LSLVLPLSTPPSPPFPYTTLFRSSALGAHGVTVAHVVEDRRLDDYAPAAWASVLVQRSAGASVVLAAGSERGNEVMAHVGARTRSEEHTSELQSPDHLVCRLLLEK